MPFLRSSADDQRTAVAAEKIDERRLFEAQVVHPQDATATAPRSAVEANLRAVETVENDVVQRPVLIGPHCQIRMREDAIASPDGEEAHVAGGLVAAGFDPDRGVILAPRSHRDFARDAGIAIRRTGVFPGVIPAERRFAGVFFGRIDEAGLAGRVLQVPAGDAIVFVIFERAAGKGVFQVGIERRRASLATTNGASRAGIPSARFGS